MPLLYTKNRFLLLPFYFFCIISCNCLILLLQLWDQHERGNGNKKFQDHFLSMFRAHSELMSVLYLCIAPKRKLIDLINGFLGHIYAYNMFHEINYFLANIYEGMFSCQDVKWHMEADKCALFLRHSLSTSCSSSVPTHRMITEMVLKLNMYFFLTFPSWKIKLFFF